MKLQRDVRLIVLVFYFCPRLCCATLCQVKFNSESVLDCICADNQYKDVSDVEACFACPANSSATAGNLNITNCLCDAGFCGLPEHRGVTNT